MYWVSNFSRKKSVEKGLDDTSNPFSIHNMRWKNVKH